LLGLELGLTVAWGGLFGVGEEEFVAGFGVAGGGQRGCLLVFVEGDFVDYTGTVGVVGG
jgi:hypothetical protein